MIISKESIARRIKAGRALLASAMECKDEEIGLTLQAFLNLMDTLDDYAKLQAENKRLLAAIGLALVLGDIESIKEVLQPWAKP